MHGVYRKVRAVFSSKREDKFEKTLDFLLFIVYYKQAVPKGMLNAAIAQSVERILGKDEVASSNLASSSKKS